jgi:hypothetical protein
VREKHLQARSARSEAQRAKPIRWSASHE